MTPHTVVSAWHGGSGVGASDRCACEGVVLACADVTCPVSIVMGHNGWLGCTIMIYTTVAFTIVVFTLPVSI